MKKLFTYAAALAMTFGLTAGIYAASGGAIAGHSIQTEQTVDDTTSNPDNDINNPDDGGTTPDGGGSNPDEGDDSSGGDTPPTPQPYTFVGDGSMSSPYTAEDVRNITPTDETALTESAWVKAVVFGYVYGTTLSETTIYRGATPPEDGNIPNTLLLIDTEHLNDEVIDLSLLVPISLGGSTEANKVLTALNLNANPQLVGTTLWLCGDISTVKGVNGLRNIESYSLDGSNILPEPEPVNVDYNLWIGAVQVSSTNAANIESDVIRRGSISFDEATKTLTLNNTLFVFSNTQNVGYAIKNEMDDLTIQIVGGVESQSMNFILSKSTTIIGGENSRLSFTGGRSIHANNTSLTLKNLILSIGMGAPGLNCSGSTLRIIKSGISIVGCVPVISAKSEPVLEDCRITYSDPSDNIAFDSSQSCYFATNSETGVRSKVRSISIGYGTAPVERKPCGLTLSKSQNTYYLNSRSTFDDYPTGVTVSGYDGTITYSSSDPSIAEVNASTGKVTFHEKSGKVVITVTASDTENYIGAVKTYTIEYTYGLTDPNIRFACGSEVYAPEGGDSFTYGVYVQKDTPAKVTLKTSDSSIVAIDSQGNIHLGSSGTAVLTATVPAISNYAAGEAKCTVHIVKSIQSNIRFTVTEPITVTYGDESSFTEPRPSTTAGYNGSITYRSSNKEIIEVDESTGKITFKAHGQATITATANPTSTFTPSNASYTIIYQKASPKVWFNQTIGTYLVSDETAMLPNLNNSGDGTPSYRSTDPSIVSVNTESGLMTFHKAGEATIIVTTSETEHYFSGSASYTVEVTSDGSETAHLDVINPGLQFASEGGNRPIKVRADRSWNISTGNAWVTVTPSSGDATFTQGSTPTDNDYVIIMISCGANDDENSRETEIVVKAGDKTYRATVVQNGTASVTPIEEPGFTPKLSVSPTSMNLVVTRANSILPMLVVRYTGDDASQISFESSDASVLRVDDDGTVHVVGQGEAVLKVKASGTEFYKPAEVSVPVTATFPDPDLVEDLAPLSGTVTVNMSALADKDMSTGGVMDDIYFSMNTDLSVGDGYSEADGCIVLNSTMTAAEMETASAQSLAELDEDGKFRGIILRVPTGTGSIVLDCKTGAHPLMVKVGANEPQQYFVSPRGEQRMDYIVSQPTLVYIYATEFESSAKALRSVRRAPKKNDATSVLIYGITVNTVADGISGVKADAAGDDAELYTVGGQRIAKKNAHGGVFVGTDGSKRAVK
jgi:uncharacterized protein YjdB